MELPEYFPVWDKLTPEEQSLLSSGASRRTVCAGDIIHNGGTDCSGLVLVKSGQFRAYIISPEGREITIYRFFERDICLFSASCMMKSLQFDITVEAEKDSDFWLIPPDVYKSVMYNSAPLANFTNEIMATGFSEVMWLIEQIMWKSLDKRLADFLLEESSIEGSDTLKITHEVIANHLGTHREVITRMLKYFQSEGAVALHRGIIELTDTKKLRSL